MQSVKGLRWRRVAGELLVVVVGILIALQVDRWDTRRQDAATERDYLVRLAADLEANERALRQLADRVEGKAAAADSLLACMGAPECAPSDELLRGLVNRTRGGGPPGFRSATFVTMMSTGALALISDPRLGEDLVRYHEDFPMPQIPDVLASTDGFVTPLFESMGRHLDDRVLYGPARFRAENPLYVTSWASFAADPTVAVHLRLTSAAYTSSASYYRLMADSTRALRGRLSGNRPVESPEP